MSAFAKIGKFFICSYFQPSNPSWKTADSYDTKNEGQDSTYKEFD